MIKPLHVVDDLWFARGTAADAAAAINARAGRLQHVTPRMVARHWLEARDAGRLPPFKRPRLGFPPGPASILRRFMEVKRGKAA